MLIIEFDSRNPAQCLACNRWALNPGGGFDIVGRYTTHCAIGQIGKSNCRAGADDRIDVVFFYQFKSGRHVTQYRSEPSGSDIRNVFDLLILQHGTGLGRIKSHPDTILIHTLYAWPQLCQLGKVPTTGSYEHGGHADLPLGVSPFESVLPENKNGCITLLKSWPGAVRRIRTSQG